MNLDLNRTVITLADIRDQPATCPYVVVSDRGAVAIDSWNIISDVFHGLRNGNVEVAFPVRAAWTVYSRQDLRFTTAEAQIRQMVADVKAHERLMAEFSDGEKAVIEDLERQFRAPDGEDDRPAPGQYV